MKRSILFALYIAFCTNLFCSTWWIKTAVQQNGIWYPWEESSYVMQSGKWDYLIVHDVIDGPSHFYFRLIINNFSIPDRKTRKAHIKNQEWYEYTGYIEYWIDDEHMDFLSCLSKPRGTIPIEAVPWLKFDGTPSIIRKSSAKIHIAPYKKTPKTYNVWFEGIGYAFFVYYK